MSDQGELDAPSFRTELKRGVNLYNLSVAFVTAVAIGIASYMLIPDLFEVGQSTQAIVVVLASFFLITAIHTGAHAYFGWRFGRGVTASRAGDHQRAATLLAPLDRSGMDHYDVSNAARQALASSRAALAGSKTP